MIKIKRIKKVSNSSFGRRTALVIGMVMGGIFGILRAVSLNYYMFMVFEFLDPLFSAGCYSVAFILGKLKLPLIFKNINNMHIVGFQEWNI